jgi:hypothetical protein
VLDALDIRGEVMMIRLAVSQDLLTRSRLLYDDPSLPFATLANQEGWRSGFISGAEWMRVVLSHVRGTEIPVVEAPFQRLGIIKYALCSLAALIYLLLVWSIQAYPLVIGVVPVFYAVEAQMVFLFPLTLDGYTNLYYESRRYTKLAGGTLHVMATVIPLAVVMLFGGFVGQGFVRSWALGCLAVVLWYEDLRRNHA